MHCGTLTLAGDNSCLVVWIPWWPWTQSRSNLREDQPAVKTCRRRARPNDHTKCLNLVLLPPLSERWSTETTARAVVSASPESKRLNSPIAATKRSHGVTPEIKNIPQFLPYLRILPLCIKERFHWNPPSLPLGQVCEKNVKKQKIARAIQES